MDLRKTLILVLTFGALVGAFALYRHFFADDIMIRSQPNVSVDSDSQLTRVGPADRETDFSVEGGAEFTTLEKGKVSQVFGFKGKLEYQRDKYWEIDQPYMKIYQQDMTIEIDASAGQVEMETAGGNMIPKDATFKGDVRIHVVPVAHSKVEECWIHMDEMVFISERSEFTSQGQISLRSQSLEMQGRNLSFVYNDYEKKVQFFRLQELDYMVVRVPQTGLFFGEQTPMPTAAAEAVVVTPADKKDNLPRVLASALAGQLYHCQLHRNVMLKTPKQAIYSSDGVILTHILWPKNALKKWQTGRGDPNDPNAPVVVEATDRVDATEPTEVNVPVTELTITCDGGVTIVPSGLDWPDLADDPATDPEKARAEALAQLAPDQSWFAARQMTHHVLQQHAVAEGPVELTFYDEGLMDPNETSILVPVKVTAQERAEYDPNTNDIYFTGDCLCTLVRRDPNTVEHYSLRAQKLTASLAQDKDDQAIAASGDVERLLADGNDVVLRILTADPNNMVDQGIAPEAVIVGAEMVCQQCDYNPAPGQEVFTAMGPGDIRLNNSRGRHASDPNRSEQPFYAFVRNFEVLRFYQAEYKIVAEARDRTMEFIYIPTVDGQLQSEITAQADHLEITLASNDSGELELQSLLATGNVFCRDPNNELSAYALSYNNKEGVVRMWSDLQQICYANGIPVPGIELNLFNGELKLDIVGPSVLPIE